MVCNILPFSMLSSAMPVNARLGVMVNQRHGDVRQQNGEGDTVRITAISTDKPYQQADQRAEDQTSFRCGGGRHWVSGDKERTQHSRAGEQANHWRRVGFRR